MDERDDDNSYDDILDRLMRLGRHPVDEVTQATHIAAMERAAAEGAAGEALLGRRRRPARARTRLAIAGAGIVGFVAGSLGLGYAGALPDPVLGVTDKVLQQVGIEPAHRNRGACVSAAARAHPDDEAAKQASKAACPRGGPPEGVRGRAGEGGPGRPEGVGHGHGRQGARPHADDPCRGAPPWAGRGDGPTEEERAAWRQGCPTEHPPEAEEQPPEAGD